MASKKRLHSPTGITPTKPKPKKPVCQKTNLKPKRLSFQRSSILTRLYPPLSTWTKEEDDALTQFVLMSCPADKWPATKNTKLWESASKFLRNMCQTVRSGGACRLRVLRSLQSEFNCPADAEVFFQSLQNKGNKENVDEEHSPSPSQLPPSPTQSSSGALSPSPSAISSGSSIAVQTVDRLQQSLENIYSLEPNELLLVLGQIFSEFCSKEGISIPEDYLQLSYKGLKQLKAGGRGNILYTVAKGYGTLRSNGSDALIPTKRLVSGLLEHCGNFFTATHLHEVKCPQDLRVCLESMYTLFGNRWLNLFSGPVWKVVETGQGSPVSLTASREIENARVNIPAISARTLQRDIAKGSFTIKAGIQVQVLNDVAKTMPDEDWWIKSDACDVVAGLMESSRMVWAGDVDLGDGELQKQYKSYISYIQLVNRIVRDQSDTHHRSCTVMDLKSISSALVKDLSFITEALQATNKKLSEKLASVKKATDKDMFSLSWKVDELGRLNDVGRKLHVEIGVLVDLLNDKSTELIQRNIPHRLTKLRDNLLPFIQGVSRHQRKVATHVLVTMISSNQRSKKPYCIPISCIPYNSLNESKPRAHINQVIKEMKKRKMK